MSIFRHKKQFQVESSHKEFNAKKLIDILYTEIQNHFPEIQLNSENSIIFDGHSIPKTWPWDLIKLIPTGKIEIRRSLRLSLVSYEIDFMKYALFDSIIFIFATILMIILNFPFLMIVIIIPVFWIISAVAMPIIVMFKFDKFITDSIERSQGRIIRGV